MYTLVIGRAYPEESTGMMGIFEFEQAKALNRNGMRTIYAFCDNRSIKKLKKFGSFTAEDEIKAYGYNLPIGGLPTKIFNRFKSKLLKKIINEIISKYGKPNIIHVHFPLLTLTDELWSFLCELQIPLATTEHWTKVQTKNLEPFRIKLLKRVVEESSAFICVGELLRESVAEITSTNKKIQVIPNMVAQEFTFEKKKKSNSSFNFISVGRLVEVKGFGSLIDSFAKAFNGNTGVTLTIVGGGKLETTLKDQVIQLGISNKVNFMGFLSRNETAKLVKESDVFVSASYLETFGVPFIEAMTCGKPVIGLKDGPIDDYITEDVGMLVNKNSLDDLSNSLIYMHENYEKFDSRFIKDYAINNFSESAVTSKLKLIYDNAMTSKR
ncbi:MULTISPECIES: glycosyltransferase [Bacillaceae]|uniref:Glycosyltransferase involved in cell wall biosynthesis n=1 Tax=Alkalicoccobacillus plakortidis TaxID=444060 RepID=A0A9D5DQ02_9BACI|nr:MULTISPECIES: glycosyltransferase [Bacillaceae]KQL56487.1 hypothetical protein AN965_13595 [Alkalicoccobacillus plakortidis]